MSWKRFAVEWMPDLRKTRARQYNTTACVPTVEPESGMGSVGHGTTMIRSIDASDRRRHRKITGPLAGH